MAGSRGVTLFVLLLSCWREARLQPVKIFSGWSQVYCRGGRNAGFWGQDPATTARPSGPWDSWSTSSSVLGEDGACGTGFRPGSLVDPELRRRGRA